MIDIGINLINKQFRYDLSKVIERAIDNGVTQMIVTGVNLENSIKAVELAKEYPKELYATAGIHPHHSKEASEENLAKIKELLLHEEVVAVGECGLDFNRNYSTPEQQEACFHSFLEIATDVGKPLFLHERDAHKRFVEIVSDYSDLPNGVVHCFTGTVDELRTYLDMGFYIGFTGAICKPSLSQLKEAVRYVPLDRLMVETDGPFMLPKSAMESPPKSRRNEPAFLPYIVKFIARCTNKSVAEIANATTDTAREFFSL